MRWPHTHTHCTLSLNYILMVRSRERTALFLRPARGFTSKNLDGKIGEQGQSTRQAGKNNRKNTKRTEETYRRIEKQTTEVARSADDRMTHWKSCKVRRRASEALQRGMSAPTDEIWIGLSREGGANQLRKRNHVRDIRFPFGMGVAGHVSLNYLSSDWSPLRRSHSIRTMNFGAFVSW